MAVLIPAPEPDGVSPSSPGPSTTSVDATEGSAASGPRHDEVSVTHRRNLLFSILRVFGPSTPMAEVDDG